MLGYLRNLSIAFLVFFSAAAQASEPEGWQSPETVAGTVAISLSEAKDLHAQGMLFIDVRSPRQFNKRRIPGAINLYVKDQFTEDSLLEVTRSKAVPFVIYCNGAHCSLSYKAATKAVNWGFTGVHYFRDGTRGWRLDGNPLEYGSGPAS